MIVKPSVKSFGSGSMWASGFSNLQFDHPSVLGKGKSPELLDECSKEDEKSVLGKSLPHANSPTKSKWNKLLLLHQADTSLTLFKEPSKGLDKLLEQPFRSELMRLVPHVWVLG